jgi:hypothetical protein
MESRKPV